MVPFSDGPTGRTCGADDNDSDTPCTRPIEDQIDDNGCTFYPIFEGIVDEQETLEWKIRLWSTIRGGEAGSMSIGLSKHGPRRELDKSIRWNLVGLETLQSSAP